MRLLDLLESRMDGRGRGAAVSKLIKTIVPYADHLGVDIALCQVRNGAVGDVELTDLFARTTGTGAGTKVMQRLIKLADQYDLNIYTTPSEPRNVKFYSRFGFTRPEKLKYWGLPLVRYPPFDYDGYLNESIGTVWYHGTPEFQKFERFEGRTISVSYITDPERWDQLQDERNKIDSSSPEAFVLNDQISKLNQYKKIRSLIFLTNNRAVAKTYADEQRAFDYQAAIGRVIAVRVRPGKTLTIDGGGQTFRGISIESVRDGLSRDGISDADITQIFAHFRKQIRGDGSRITTDSLAAIVDDLGYDIVDVLRIKDNFMGGGRPSIVRMVMNPDLIDVIRPGITETNMGWGGCWIKPNGEVLHLVPNPHEPIHHAEHVFDDPELDAIVDARATDDAGEHSNDVRDIAVDVALEHGWIRIRTHTRGVGEIIIQYETDLTKPAKRELRDYIMLYRGVDRFNLNGTNYADADSMVKALG